MAGSVIDHAQSPVPPIVIRLARADDVPRCQQIEVEAGAVFRTVGLDAIADDDPPTIAELQAHLDTATIWVAEDRELGVVGYAIASVVDGEGHVDQVSVAPVASGRRIGARLVDQIATWASTQGLDALTLTTFRDVAWNGPYYARLGFTVLDEGACGPQLRAIRQRERDSGVELAPRIAMRRPIGGQSRSPRG